MKVREIAEAVGGQVVGDGEREITSVASLATVTRDELSFVEDAKFTAAGEKSIAGVLVVNPSTAEL